MTTAYFAGGCFWCITPTFKEMPGVADVVSGYAGGDEINPTYELVKSQKTGHRETIRIDFDENTVTFASLLDIFLCSIDPYDDGGQFIDRGHSYTLAIYPTDAMQEAAARKAVDALQAQSDRKVCIAIKPFKSFYPAEEYHQDYYLKHPVEFQQELIDSGRLERSTT